MSDMDGRMNGFVEFRASVLMAAGALAMAGIMGFSGAARAELPPTDELLKERVLGDPNAPVEMQEFASFTCPHCADFQTRTLPALKEKYIDTGKLKLIARDFPLDRSAAIASMVARCVPEENYFPVTDVLFHTQRGWATAEDPVAELKRIGGQAGLSPEDFDACLQNQDLLNGILKSRQDASTQHEINSTPTFILNGAEKIAGAQDVAVFEEAIDRLLSKAGVAVAQNEAPAAAPAQDAGASTSSPASSSPAAVPPAPAAEPQGWWERFKAWFAGLFD